MRYCFVVIPFLFFGLLNTDQDTSRKYASVLGESGRLYSQPTSQASVIAMVNKGDSVLLIDYRSTQYFRVSYFEFEGYIHRNYLLFDVDAVNMIKAYNAANHVRDDRVVLKSLKTE